MKRIFWGVMGEGLGHVTRTLAVIEHLPECEVHIFTSGKALAYLTGTAYPHLHAIDGLMFRYRNGRVAQLASLRGAVSFFLQSRARNVRQILTAADRLQPELLVTDFEPSLPVVARRSGLPLVSVDNQHRFSHCSVRDLPWGLRCYAMLVGQYIRRAMGQPRVAVISTFCPEYLRSTAENAVVVDSVIRPAVAALPTVDEGFVVAYVRDSIRAPLLACLHQLDRRSVVYGAAAEECRGPVEARPLSPDFVHDLARCAGVVSTAGHQLISEAYCLGKPMLVIPEPGQYEQYINAFYLEKVGGGRRCDLTSLSPHLVQDFVDSATPRPRRSASGAAEVAKIIRAELFASPVSDLLSQIPREAFA
jgi:uncharacterized protein (TIGR00661 family)